MIKESELSVQQGYIHTQERQLTWINNQFKKKVNTHLTRRLIEIDKHKCEIRTL